MDEKLLGEDDENWFEIGSSFSSYWLCDLIQQLQLAKQAIETLPEARCGYGREFESR